MYAHPALFEQVSGLPVCNDAATGAVLIFRQAIFGGSFKSPKFIGDRWLKAEVIRESYGAERGQHTFTLRVIASEGCQALEPGATLRIKGRNLYRDCWQLKAADPQVLEDKHQRGEAVRAAKAQLKASGEWYRR